MSALAYGPGFKVTHFTCPNGLLWFIKFEVKKNLEDGNHIKRQPRSENDGSESVARKLSDSSEHALLDKPAELKPHDGTEDSTIVLDPQHHLKMLSDSLGRLADSAATSENHLPVDSLVGEKYKILGFLGEGGMSSVYKAKHILTGKIVALKVMHGRLLNDVSSFKRFHQEAIAASRLDHPNAISVSDMGAAGSQPYLVMDYVDGCSLATVIREEGRLSVERALTIFIQAASALASAHKLGIVHRDLKPTNIMLVRTEDGNDLVKLVDFGIAKIISQTGESQKLTATGEVFGSPLYMSPEQAEGKPIDMRSDMYSMGCLMYEALSGSPPFYGENVISTLLKHLSVEPPLLKDLDTSNAVQTLLNKMVQKALCKDPDKRQTNMSELLDELTEILQVQVGAKTAGYQFFFTPGFKRVLKTISLAVVSIVALCLIATALFYSSELGMGQTPSPDRRDIYPVPVVITGQSTQDFKHDKSLSSAFKQLVDYEERARVCRVMGLKEKAYGLFAQAGNAFDSARGALGACHLGHSMESAESRMNLAECLMYLHKYKAAERAASEALDNLEEIGHPLRNWDDRCKSVIAYSLWRTGDIEKARNFYQSLWEARENSYLTALSTQVPADFAFHLTAAALFYSQQALKNPADFEKATEFSQSASDRLTAVSQANRAYEQSVTYNLGALKNARARLEESAGRMEEAEADFQAAVNCFSDAQGADDLGLAYALFNQSDLQWRRHNWIEALQARFKAKQILAHSKKIDR